MNPDNALDRRLTQALEAPPQIHIADDFALRVLAHLPADAARSAMLPQVSGIGQLPSTGRRVAYAALAILFAAMLAVSRSSPGNASLAQLTAEWICATEFILLSLWLALRPEPLR